MEVADHVALCPACRGVTCNKHFALDECPDILHSASIGVKREEDDDDDE